MVTKLEIPRRFWGLMEYQRFSTTPGYEGFQVRKSIRQKLANSKRRIQRRLDKNGSMHDLESVTVERLTRSAREGSLSGDSAVGAVEDSGSVGDAKRRR